jgi:hypothetical protein
MTEDEVDAASAESDAAGSRERAASTFRHLKGLYGARRPPERRPVAVSAAHAHAHRPPIVRLQSSAAAKTVQGFRVAFPLII